MTLTRLIDIQYARKPSLSQALLYATQLVGQCVSLKLLQQLRFFRDIASA